MEGSDSARLAQETHPPDDRLDSWKEIAAYLRRDESTVRRWEKDGLPVHRHRHKFRAAIFAYKSELDAWWNNCAHNDAQNISSSTPQQQEEAPRISLAPPDLPEAVQSKSQWPSTPIARRLLALLAFALLLTVGYWAWQNLARGPGPTKPVMLAVLPLVNLSGNPNEEYFSDGLTEEMITQLSRLQPARLGVIARTSSMSYKGTKKRADEIGRELHVDYLMEGSVRRDSEQVRISVQLIRTSDQTHLWAQNYQRDARDILALQSQVATAVAREISVQLSAQGRAVLASTRAVNPRAHELYLRGRYHWNKRTEAELQKSIEYFQQAIQEDPAYAASYAALADAYNVMGNWGLLPPREAYPRAKAAASKALEIDAGIAEARIARAYATHLYDWNPAAAEKEFKQGLELNPNYAPGHQWYAVHLASVGQFDAAIAQIKRAQELDPLSLIIGDVVGWIYSLARRCEPAIAEFRRAIELDPNFFPTHYDLGIAYAECGMPRESLAEMEKARSISGDTPRTVSGLAYAYALAGQNVKAKKLLNDLIKLSKHRYVPPFDIAVVYAALGENDLAFTWLEKAYEDRHPWLVMLRVTPKVDRLRSDPRFPAFLRRAASSTTSAQR